MPLYHDLTHARRQRLLHPWHLGILAEFVLALKKERYDDRAYLPKAVHALTDDDITNDAVGVWAFIRIELADYIKRTKRPPEPGPTPPQLVALTRGARVITSGWVKPTLIRITAKIMDENDEDSLRKSGAPWPDWHRARRDLQAAVGMRVAACTAHLDVEEVFARAS
jgi:hypothetical protein